jgi:hypothetical protein
VQLVSNQRLCQQARIARDREPVDLTMDDILAARDEGRR